MKDLPLNAMRAFASIFEAGGIRPAARALGISHSSVSRHLRELEAWIGCELIDREEGHRELSFTNEGKQLGKAARLCFGELEQTVSALRESRRSNSVVVDTTPSFATRWLLPRISSFETQAPWAELSVVVAQQQRSPGEYGRDISIRMGKGTWGDGAVESLMSDELFPVASPLYWQSHSRPMAPSDLAGHRLLHDQDPNASWAQWQDRFAPNALDVRKGPRFGSSDLVLRAAEQGLGIALAYGRMAEESLRTGLLEPVFVDCRLKLGAAYWIVAPPKTLRRPVRAFIDWLKEEAALRAHDA